MPTTVGTQLYLGDKFINNAFLGATDVVFNPFTAVDSIPTNGLVAWYDASNAASYPGTGATWTDLSPLAGSGSLVGSPTFNSTTKLFTFNGINQRVDLTNFLSSGQRTYSMYAIMKANNNGTQQVFGQGTESNNQRAFIIRFGGYYGFNGYNNDANQPTGMDVASGTLTSAAFTMDNGAANQSQALRFYRNGIFKVTVGTSGGATNLNVGTTAARIATNAGGGEWFNGDIGVCIAYDRVLSDAEITTINNYYSTKYTLV